MEPKVLISLHDVTPFHLTRLNKAEILFKNFDLSSVSFLLIPNYHNLNSQYPQHVWKAFKDWIERERAYRVQWILHGYSHKQESIYEPTPQVFKNFINR